MSMHDQGFGSSMTAMRRLAGAVLLAAVICVAALWTALSSASGATASDTKTFNFTGGEQVFVVPDGVTSISVRAVGGRGGTSGGGTQPNTGASGGLGAVAAANLAVSPGQILFVNVGGNGAVVTGGFNGGGAGGNGDDHDGGGGGGATDIRTISRAGGGGTLSSRLVIAAGGGGGGGNSGSTSGTGGGLGGSTGNLPSGFGHAGGSGSVGLAPGVGGAPASPGGAGGNGSLSQAAPVERQRLASTAATVAAAGVAIRWGRRHQWQWR